MTTPDGLTAESEALLRDILRHVVVHGPGGVTVHDGDLRDALAAIEAAALARHVRETGCEVVADTDLLSMAASMVRGDGVCEKPHRDGEANPHYHFDVVHELGNRLANIRRRRLVRETGCDGLREALRRLIDAIETTGLHEHDDGRGGVDLCVPIAGIRSAMHVACAAAGHEFLRPGGVPPFCRWCGAATARSAGEPDALEAARATCISALQETWQRVYRLRPVVDAAVRWSTSTDEADTNALLAAVEAYERAIQPEEAPK